MVIMIQYCLVSTAGFFFERFWSLLFYKIRQKLSFLNFQWVFREKYSVFFDKLWWIFTFCHWVFDYLPKNEDSAQKLHKNECFYWCYCCYIEKICENLSFWLFLAWVLPKTVSFLKFVSSFSSEFFSKRSKKSLHYTHYA